MQFTQALHLIVDNTPVLNVETVALESSFGRVCTGNNRSNLPVPCYDQSTRDGYAVRGNGEPSAQGRVFRICGEIAAGPGVNVTIEPGEAYRIMTGGLIPAWTDRVIPQEKCSVGGGELFVGEEHLSEANRFIRRSGYEHGAGDVIAEDGARVNEVLAARFASSGNKTLEVYKKPTAAFLCSGSELVTSGDTLERGQKFSSNHYLLQFLIEQHGAISRDYGVIHDKPDEIERTLGTIAASDADVIISTGGVGPGKYDLFSAVLPRLGARIHYRSLAVRPGRSTLFAELGGKLYFGLPGPPSAVHILFREMVAPALRKMQGFTDVSVRRSQAFLNHDIFLKSSDVLCLKEGRYSFENGNLMVQFSERLQVPNCIIYLEPGRNTYKQGDRVEITLFEL